MLVRERAELESARQSLEEAQRQEDVADREVNRAMEERDRAENEICARRDAVARASVDASRKKRELEDGERQVRDVQARFDSLKAILEERKRDSERKREEIATLQREGRSAVLGAVNSQQFGDTKGVDGIAKKFSEADALQTQVDRTTQEVDDAERVLRQGMVIMQSARQVCLDLDREARELETESARLVREQEARQRNVDRLCDQRRERAREQKRWEDVQYMLQAEIEHCEERIRDGEEELRRAEEALRFTLPPSPPFCWWPARPLPLSTSFSLQRS